MFDLGRLVKLQEFQSEEEAHGFIEQFVGPGKTIPESIVTMTPVERAQDKMYLGAVVHCWSQETP